MTIPDPVTTTSLRIATRIAFGLYAKFTEPDVDAEIKAAFEKALETWSKNEGARKIMRIKLRSLVEHQSSMTTKSKEWDDEQRSFYEHFEKALAGKTKAYRYLKELKDEERHRENMNQLELMSAALTKLVDQKGLGSELQKEWKRQLEVYAESIQEFKPKTALKLLEQLEDSIKGNNIEPSDGLKSQLLFMKADCYSLLGDAKNTNKYRLLAYDLEPDVITYLERACHVYALQKNFDEAEKLRKELVAIDPEHPVAHLVELMFTDSNELEQVLQNLPLSVKESDSFNVSVFFSIREKYGRDGIDVLRKNGLAAVEVGDFESLTYENFRNRTYMLEMLIGEVLGNVYIDFNTLPSDSKGLVKHLNGLLSDFLKVIEGSEISDRFLPYKMVLAYTEFVLDPTEEKAISFSSSYENLPPNLTELVTIHVANALQLTGKPSTAIEVINKSGQVSPELLLLNTICIAKSRKIEIYGESVLQFIGSLQLVSEAFGRNLIQMLYNLRQFDQIEKLNDHSLIANLEFESEDLKRLTLALLDALSSEPSDSILTELAECEPIAKDFGEPAQFVLAYVYNVLNQTESCFRVFNDIEQLESDDMYLFHYIQFLFSTKVYNTELLERLVFWRNSFETVDEFLRMEADLRSQVRDWTGCKEICEVAFSASKEKSEGFLTLYVVSCLHLEDYDQIIGLSDELQSHSFKNYDNARSVAQGLIQSGEGLKGLEVMMPFASNPTDARARQDFLTLLWFNQGIPLEEGETAEIGWWVSYSFNDKIHFILIEEGNKLSEKFLGKRVGDTVEVGRPQSGMKDSLIVTRIMDKFLYLHDAILEEISENPHAGFDIESFQFSGGKEELESQLKSFFGEKGSSEKVRTNHELGEYKAYRKSLSEIMNSVYHSDFLGGYFDLVHNQNGITQIPINHYPIFSLERKPLILDWSALVLLYQISRDQELNYNMNFIVSHSLVEGIKRKLKSERKVNSDQLSLSITSNDVRKNVKPLQVTESNVAYIEGLLGWINGNCTIKVPTSKLDIVRNIDRPDEENLIADFAIDNLCLLIEEKESVLISDDSMYFKMIGINSKQIVSTEYYLNSIFHDSEESKKKYQLEFVKNRYNGFLPSVSILKDEYYAFKAGKPNNYPLCVSNLSLFRFQNPDAVNIAIDFMKQVLLDGTLTQENIESDFVGVLVNLLGGVRLKEVYESVHSKFHSEFRLMGTSLDFGLKCYLAALTVLGKSDQE